MDPEVEGLRSHTLCTLHHYGYRSSCASNFLTNTSEIAEKLDKTRSKDRWNTVTMWVTRQPTSFKDSACSIVIWNVLCSSWRTMAAALPTTNRVHRSSYPQANACTTKTLTHLFKKFKWKCHMTDLMYFIYTGNFRNIHLLFGLNVWIVL